MANHELNINFLRFALTVTSPQSQLRLIVPYLILLLIGEHAYEEMPNEKSSLTEFALGIQSLSCMQIF